jgi:hypothetical protein
LALRRRGDDLLVCEPDFGGDPFTEVREDVTCTLAVLVGQAAVINRLGVEPAEGRFDDLGIHLRCVRWRLPRTA